MTDRKEIGKMTDINHPLFIPLRREYFEAFKRGGKDVEYRLYGRVWNERVCQIGRPVTLSLGYGKKNRLSGVITSFEKKPALKSKGWMIFSLIYGITAGYVAEIGIAAINQVKE